MAVGDVTILGPYREDQISNITTDLEALSPASVDQITSFTLNGGVYVLHMDTSA